MADRFLMKVASIGAHPWCSCLCGSLSPWARWDSGLASKQQHVSRWWEARDEVYVIKLYKIIMAVVWTLSLPCWLWESRGVLCWGLHVRRNYRWPLGTEGSLWADNYQGTEDHSATTTRNWIQSIICVSGPGRRQSVGWDQSLSQHLNCSLVT